MAGKSWPSISRYFLMKDPSSMVFHTASLNIWCLGHCQRYTTNGSLGDKSSIDLPLNLWFKIFKGMLMIRMMCSNEILIFMLIDVLYSCHPRLPSLPFFIAFHLLIVLLTKFSLLLLIFQLPWTTTTGHVPRVGPSSLVQACTLPTWSGKGNVQQIFRGKMRSQETRLHRFPKICSWRSSYLCLFLNALVQVESSWIEHCKLGHR